MIHVFVSRDALLPWRFAPCLLLSALSVCHTGPTFCVRYLKLPPVKLHCSMLAEDAIKAAVKDYKTKQEAKIAFVEVSSSSAKA